MARLPDLEPFAQRHRLRILTIADLIRYRLVTERLVRRAGESKVVLDQTRSEWRALVYETTIDERQFLVLIKGDLDGASPPLCRVHAGATLADTFATAANDGGGHLREAITRIEAAGRGALVYIVPRGDIRHELEKLRASSAGLPPRSSIGPPLREFGLGAQVLADLGLHQIRLLTNNPRKIAGIHGFGLDVVERVPLSLDG
jgi:3,4-dihydroxy 2-butanone 4-phosphate synthase/GTP cyclohydrolase II